MRRLNRALLPSVLIFTAAILLFRTAVASTASPSSSHKNCGGWSHVASPNVGTGSNFLYSIAAISSSNVWTVGEYGNGNGSSTLVEHWNGKQWSVVASPNVRGTSENVLAGVTAIAANNVWAVGSSTTSNFVQQTLIEHWNGGQWSIVASPNVAALDNGLTAVSAVSATDIWAVGNSSGANGYQTLIEHWNGKAWSIVASLTQGTSDLIGGIAAVSASNIWVVGDYTRDIDPAFGTYLTLIEHWNGTAWSVVNSPSPGSIASDLVSAAAIPKTSKVWAAGFVQNDTAYQTLTEFYC